jgi:glutathione synthase
MTSTLRIGFLADPIESFVVGHDTTFTFMLEARRRGHHVLFFEQRDLFVDERGAGARMRWLEVRKTKGDHFSVLDERAVTIADLDVLFLRKDPPVDVDYLHATQLVELGGSRTRPFRVNEPAGLRDANEKLFALRFPELMPRTLVTSDLVRLRSFVGEVGGEMIVKPVDGFAGRGIFHVRREDRNLNSILEVATDRGREAIVAQEYLPASREGDKRILLLDGEPLGAMLRVPQTDDVRGNLAAGGRFQKTAITERDLEICRRLAPALRERGLWFVGIDVIGRHLTEVNVTSPTGVEEIDALEGTSIPSCVLDFVESRVA